jgi:hypothetical protein
MKAIKNITILWTEQLSMFMFSDFLKTLYLKDTDYQIISATLYDEVSSVQRIIKDKLGQKVTVFLVRQTKVLNPENAVYKELLGVSDVIVSLKSRKLEDLNSLHTKQECLPEWEEIKSRWVLNLDRLAKSV